MERRFIPETENKLILLYALRALGPVTGMQLIQFLAELDLMNYFTMQLSLSDMEKQGQIKTRAHPLGSLMDITAEGAFTLESFTGKIPRSRRQLIDQEAPAWQERFRSEQMAPTEAVTGPQGVPGARLKLLESDAVLMDVTLLGEDVPRTRLEQRWRRTAPTVYQEVTQRLMAGFTPDVPAPQGDDPALTQASRAEWLLTLQDSPERPGLILLLTLPDEQLARWCLARWPAACADLRQSIVDALQRAQVLTFG